MVQYNSSKVQGNVPPVLNQKNKSRVPKNGELTRTANRILTNKNRLPSPEL